MNTHVCECVRVCVYFVGVFWRVRLCRCLWYVYVWQGICEFSCIYMQVSERLYVCLLVNACVNKWVRELRVYVLRGWLVGFYGISTFVGYLTPNPFLYK